MSIGASANSTGTVKPLWWMLPAFLAVVLYLPSVTMPLTTAGDYAVGSARAIGPLHCFVTASLPPPRGMAARHFPESYIYRPLAVLSYKVIGDADWAQRLTGVLLHGVNCVLLAVLLRALGASGFAGILAGVLYALHPVASETVIEVANRGMLLAASFTLSGLVLLAGGASRNQPLGVLRRGAVFAAFLAATLSHEAGLLWVAAASACYVAARHTQPAPDGSPSSWRRRLACVIPGAVALSAYGALRMWALGTLWMPAPPAGLTFVENPTAGFGASGVVAGGLSAVARYCAGFAWPVKLSADYSFSSLPLTGAKASLWAVAGAMTVLGFVVLAAMARRRKPAAFFAAVYALFALLAVSNLLVLLPKPFSESYAYPVLSAACALAALGVAAVRRRLAGGRWHSALAAVMVLALACLGARTFARERDWRSRERLVEATLAAYPDNVHALVTAARGETAAGNLDRAGELLERARGLCAGDPDVLNALTTYYLRSNQPDRAAESAWAALEARRDAEALVNAAVVASEDDRPQDARRHLEEAVRLERRNKPALANLGLLALRDDDYERAASYFARVLEADPEDSATRLKLAFCYLQTQEPMKATLEALEVLQRVPEDSQSARMARSLSEAAQELIEGDKSGRWQ